MARSIRTGLSRRFLLPALLAPAILAGLAPTAVADASAPGDPILLEVTAPPPPLGVDAAHVFAVRATQSGRDVDVPGDVTLSVRPEGSCDEFTCTFDEPGEHSAGAVRNGEPASGFTDFLVVPVDTVVLLPAGSTVPAEEPKKPAASTVTVGTLQAYTARGWATGRDAGDVTARTALSTGEPGFCDKEKHACGSDVPGRYTVSGRLDGAKNDGTAMLTVEPRLASIRLDPETATIVAGATQVFRVDGFGPSGEPLDDVTGRVEFRIDRGGRCDGNECGAERVDTYTVTATAAGVRPATAALTVIPGPAAAIELQPRRAKITAGAEQPYTVLARDAHRNPAGDVTDLVRLTMTKRGTCDLDSCTATRPDGYHVTASFPIGGGRRLTAEAVLTVVPDRVVGLQLRADSDEIVAGARRAYTAFGFDRFGNPLGDVTARTTFSTDRSGRCEGASCGADRTGDYTVTGRHTGTGAIGRAVLHVLAGPLIKLVLAPDGARVGAGAALPFEARGRDALGNDVGDLTAGSKFTIDRGGTCVRESCSADEPGDHTVTATRIGTRVRGRVVLHVVTGPLSSATLEPTTAAVTVGASVRYQVRGFDAKGNPRGDVTDRALFSIQPEGSCHGSSCTAAEPVRHTVVARVAGRAGTLTAVLEVQAKPAASLRLDPSEAVIAVGAGQQYRVEALAADGTSLGDVSRAASLSIDRDGSCGRSGCTARRPGTYRVQASMPGTLASGEAVLHVQRGEPAILELEPASVAVAVGSAQAFRARAWDAAGNFLGDVTRQTVFSVGPDGSCDGPTCTPAAAGRHTVTGRTVVGSAQRTAALTVVTVSPPPSRPTGSTQPPPPPAVEGIVAEPATGQVAAGAWFALAVRAVDATGRDLGDVTSKATMVISPDGSCSDGRCTARVTGTHQVAIAARGERTAATLEVVAAGQVTRIMLDPQDSAVRTDAAQDYRAWGFDAYGNELGDVTDRTTFSIRGVGPCAGAACSVERPGVYEVIGAADGAKDTVRLEVVPVPAATLVLDPSSGSVEPGTPMAFRVRGYDDVGNDLGDLTGAARFAIRPGGRCSPAGCTADTAGAYTVTASAPAGVAGSLLSADAALQVLRLRPAGLPVPAWSIGLIAAVVAILSGGVLALAFPGSQGGPGRSYERERRPDRHDRPRTPHLSVRPVPDRPTTRLQQRRRLRPEPWIRIEPHGDPDGVQTVREGPP